MTDARTPSDHHQDVFVTQILLSEDDLYALHEALPLWLEELADRRAMFAEGEIRRELTDEIDSVLRLSTRISGRIDDLIIARGGDPT